MTSYILSLSVEILFGKIGNYSKKESLWSLRDIRYWYFLLIKIGNQFWLNIWANNSVERHLWLQFWGLPNTVLLYLFWFIMIKHCFIEEAFWSTVFSDTWGKVMRDIMFCLRSRSNFQFVISSNLCFKRETTISEYVSIVTIPVKY